MKLWENGVVVGPRLPPPCWEEANKIIEDAVYKATWAERDEAQRALDKAYGAFADLAEEELEHATGANIEHLGNRSANPKFVWRSVLPETKPKGGDPTAAALGWMEGVVREVGRIAKGPEAAGAAFPPGADVGADGEAAGDARDGDDADDATGRAETTVDVDCLDGDDADLLDDSECGLVLDDIIESLIADYPAEATDAIVVRLHSRVLDVAAEARVLGEATAEAKREFWSNLATLTEDVEKAAREAETDETKKALGDWRAWLMDGIDEGARHAHMHTRLPQEWVPTTVISEELEVLTNDPTELLREQRTKYAMKWQATEHPRRAEWPTREALPRLGEDEVDTASVSFPWRTSATFDGFHPRHWTLLSPAAKRATGALCEAVELLGALPTQLSLVTMPLISKPQGGHRAIGMIAALLRVWARARRPLAEKWEENHRRGYWSADRGNSPLDTIWRQEARQEAAAASGRQAAALLNDLDSFYETVDRDLLLRRARATGFPEPIVRVCLALYACPRMLTLDGALSREVHPARGIIAGDAMATTLVKVYCVGAFDELCVRLPPSVKMDAHIDDIVLTAEAQPREILADVPKAAELLHKVIKDELRCTIAESKAGLVATTRELATELRRRIPGLTGPVTASVPNLGMDCRAAAPRGRARRSTKRFSRFWNGNKRTKRLRSIAKILKRRTRTIFMVGIAAATHYGAAVQGLSDIEVRKLRRMAMSALPPRTRFRSLTCSLLINQVPTALAELAPALQHARMVWKAKTQPDQSRMRNSSLTDLRAWYEAAAPGFAPLAEVASECARRAGPIGEPQVNRAWRKVRGPLGSAAMALGRIGWKYVNAFEWSDDRGVTIQLTANTPAAIADLLTEGHRRALERQLGKNRAERDNAYSGGRRACADLAENYLKGACPRGITPQQRGAFRAAATDAVLTNSRACSLGYIVSDICPLCGTQGDTLYHRVYECECTREDVETAAPRWFLEEARNKGREATFFTTGIFPHPADLWPLPSRQQTVVAVDYVTESGEYVARGLGTRSGAIFVDGSCTTSQVRGIARAGCAAVEVDEQGRIIREVGMVIPAAVAQTPQAAEYGGLLLAIGQLEAEADLYTDCLGVQRAYEKGPGKAIDARRKHGATVLLMGSDPDKKARVRNLRWVKAHREIDSAANEQEEWMIKGNAAADEAAKRAVKSHPQPDPQAVAELEYYCRRFPLVAKVVGIALAKFPPAPGNLQRRPPPRSHDEARQRGCHVWRRDEDRWRCEACWTWCAGRAVPRYRRLQACPGTRDTKEAREYTLLGHRMRAIQASPPFLFCVKCGGSSLRRAYKLSRRCEEPNASGRQALKRVAKGLHPWRAKDKRTGKETCRGTLGSERAFDADTGTWIECKAGVVSAHATGRLLKHNGCGVAVKHKGRREGEQSVRNQQGGIGGAAAAAGGTVIRSDIVDHGSAEGHWPGDSDVDVFGHGGSLDQEHGDGPTGGGSGENDDVAMRDNDGRGSRCTIVERAEGMEPTRLRTSVWINGRRGTVECHGEDGRLRVLGAIETLGEARREDRYAVVVDGAGMRLVFTCTEEADRFDYQWRQARREAASAKRASEPPSPSAGGGIVLEADRRAAKARERIDSLRMRVVNRARAVTGWATSSTPNAEGQGETSETGPAPSTPIVQVGGEDTRNDQGRVISTGCGCGGRLHEGCARRVRPRLDIREAAATEAEAVEAADRVLHRAPDPNGEAEIGAQCKDGQRRKDAPGGLPMERGAPANGQRADPGTCGLRADPIPRDHHLLHVHHHRAGTHGDGGGGCEAPREDGHGEGAEAQRHRDCQEHEQHGHEQHSRRRHRREQERMRTDVGKGTEDDRDRDGRHSYGWESDRKEDKDALTEGHGQGGDSRREGWDGNTHAYTSTSYHHQPDRPALEEERRHAGLRADPLLGLGLQPLRGASSWCSARPPRSASPPPSTDAWVGECAKPAGRDPCGDRPQIALATRQGISVQVLRQHGNTNLDEGSLEPNETPHGPTGSNGQARDGGGHRDGRGGGEAAGGPGGGRRPRERHLRQEARAAQQGPHEELGQEHGERIPQGDGWGQQMDVQADPHKGRLGHHVVPHGGRIPMSAAKRPRIGEGGGRHQSVYHPHPHHHRHHGVREHEGREVEHYGAQGHARDHWRRRAPHEPPSHGDDRAEGHHHHHRGGGEDGSSSYSGSPGAGGVGGSADGAPLPRQHGAEAVGQIGGDGNHCHRADDEGQGGRSAQVPAAASEKENGTSKRPTGEADGGESPVTAGIAHLRTAQAYRVCGALMGRGTRSDQQATDCPSEGSNGSARPSLAAGNEMAVPEAAHDHQRGGETGTGSDDENKNVVPKSRDQLLQWLQGGRVGRQNRNQEALGHHEHREEPGQRDQEHAQRLHRHPHGGQSDEGGGRPRTRAELLEQLRRPRGSQSPQRQWKRVRWRSASTIAVTERTMAEPMRRTSSPGQAETSRADDAPS